MDWRISGLFSSHPIMHSCQDRNPRIQWNRHLAQSPLEPCLRTDLLVLWSWCCLELKWLISCCSFDSNGTVTAAFLSPARWVRLLHEPVPGRWLLCWPLNLSPTVFVPVLPAVEPAASLCSSSAWFKFCDCTLDASQVSINFHSFWLWFAGHQLIFQFPVVINKECLNEIRYRVYAFTHEMVCSGMAEGARWRISTRWCPDYRRHWLLSHHSIELYPHFSTNPVEGCPGRSTGE